MAQPWEMPLAERGARPMAHDDKYPIDGWWLVIRAMEIIHEKMDSGELSTSQWFCLARDFTEFRSDGYTEWQKRNPEKVAELDAERERALLRLQAKVRDGSLVAWCERHGVDPRAVASFAYGGDGRQGWSN